MLTFVAFVGAVAIGIFVFEILNLVLGRRGRDTRNEAQIRLDSMPASEDQEAKVYKRNTLESLVVALWPSRFDPNRARDRDSVESLLRRSGYYYKTVGEFYAAALRDFVMFLVLGVVFIFLMSLMNFTLVGVIMAAALIYNGLRWPYGRLRSVAKQRADALQNNMLVGLSVMEAVTSAGKDISQATKVAAGVGGPFCAILGYYNFMVTKGGNKVDTALDAAKTFLPDPNNLDAVLFLDTLKDIATGEQARLVQVIRAHRLETHRKILNAAEARASQVRSMSVLYGFLAAVGMILTLVLPYVFTFNIGF
jgi:Flp pilus assembly protein TadB